MAIAIAISTFMPAWAQETTELISQGPGGVPASGSDPAISADGRFVAFTSRANLGPGKKRNGYYDIFVRDRQTGTTRQMNVGLGGFQANRGSQAPSISADGRFVAFNSDATNLVPGDTNEYADVFVHDRQKGTIQRVSVGPHGVQADSSSSASALSALSADGRFVAFSSGAANLVPGDTKFWQDVFVRDLKTGVTERVSVGPGGVQGNLDSNSAALSADGRFVAFWSYASNLVPGDTNGRPDLFVRDRKTGVTKRVNLGPGLDEDDFFSAPVLSADGRFVAFDSSASNLVPGDTNGWNDVFVSDRRKGTIQRVSVGPHGVQGNEFSGGPSISADGRFVAFSSGATNLVLGDTNEHGDVFVRDRQTGTTRRVSVRQDGTQGNCGGFEAALSADGRSVAFGSSSERMIPGLGGSGGIDRVFVRTLAP